MEVDEGARPSAQVARIVLSGGTEVQLPAGGVTAIVGGNNTGKSTLLRQIARWLSSDAPQSLPPHEHKILDQLEVGKSGSPEEFAEWLKKNSAYQRPTVDNVSLAEGYVRPSTGQSALSHDAAKDLWRRLESGHLGRLNPFLVHYIGAAAGFSFGAGQRPRPGSPPSHDLHYLDDYASLRDSIDEMCHSVFGVHLTLDKLGQQMALRVGRVPDDIPPPGYYDDALPFREALDKLSLLDSQGDGMKAFIGKLLPIMTSAYHIVLMDEPEAFLHPPQAVHLGRLLGKLSRETGVQIILATHDRNIIIGLLSSECALSVVRLNRQESATTASQLEPGEISAIWSDPVLRYSHVLDGLFHSRVVLVENERDCTFYAAALDAAHDAEALPVPPSEVLFVPTNGKDGLAPVVRALKAIRVPAVASPDIDILNDRQKIKKLVEHLGHDWSEFDSQYDQITRKFREPRRKLLVSQVAPSIQGFLERTLSDDPKRVWDAELAADLRALTRTEDSPWLELKNYGTDAFAKDVELKAIEFLEKLDEIGLVVVRVGELEGFARGFGVDARKGNGWLRAALEAGVHKSSKAIEHARRLCTVPVFAP